MSRLLVVLLLPLATQALRVPLDAANVSRAGAISQLQESEERSGTSRLPLLAHFTEVWKQRYALERHLDDPMPTSVRLVMGLFTQPKEKAYRDVIRSTWLKQRGVCYWSKKPQKGCSVYIALVMGLVAQDTEEIKAAYNEPGVLKMEVGENMNSGKSPRWMQLAWRWFPWATHYGKMDMDTYPFFHKLLARMDRNRTCVEGTSDYEWIGRPCTAFMDNMGPFTQACPYQSCQGWYHTPALDYTDVQGAFTFMAGEFYILNKALVAGIPWSSQVGNEDVVIADFVYRFSRGMRKCVVLRKLDAHAHLGTPKYMAEVEAAGVVNEAFANDF